MINQLSIQNFKSYSQTAVLKLAPLTLLIGTNASGKSNAIEAIRLLSWLANGRRLDDILRQLHQEDISIRGTLSDLTFNQSDTDKITLGCVLGDVGEWQNFSITLQVNPQNEIRIVAESISSDENKSKAPLYWIKDPAPPYSHEVQVAFNNFSRGGLKPTIPCTDQQAIFTQLDIPSRFAISSSLKPQEVIPQVVKKLQQALHQVLFLDPIPRHMTRYSFMVETELQGDGSNVSSVLYDLCKRQGKTAVLSFIRSLPEQDIIDITFIQTPRNEVMLQLTESFGGQQIKREAPLLSDGTLRVLAVVAALLSAPQGSFIIIEEVDNGIHPSRAQKLLNNIQQIAQERGLRVLLTSHNPALLDSLPNEAIPHVVVCYRDAAVGDSRLVRLEDLTEYPELVARGTLGQLMTKGVIERFVKSQRTPEQKKNAALKWLEELKQQVELVP